MTIHLKVSEWQRTLNLHAVIMAPFLVNFIRFLYMEECMLGRGSFSFNELTNFILSFIVILVSENCMWQQLNEKVF